MRFLQVLRGRRRAVPALTAVLALLVLGACAPPEDGAGGGTATGCGTAAFDGAWGARVVSHEPMNSTGATEDEWSYFFTPCAATGEWGGSLDVVSLGYDPQASDTGGTLTLGLGTSTDPADAVCAVDESGADLAVYENPFEVYNSGGIYTEVALLAVSQDAQQWYAFDATRDESLALDDPARYSGYAGVTPSSDGGDRFDLADVAGLPTDFRACYVRLTDGGTAHEDYGNSEPDYYNSGADIDAVQALHHEPAPGLSP